MTKPSPQTRERIVVGAADMVGRRALSATSIREMAKYAKAPLGSTHHYFPEGKQQLQWESLLADSLRAHGAEARQAAQLSTLIVAAVEGTVALCRARRSTRPLDHIAEQLQALIATAVKD